ncbi:ATP-binding protein [Myxococcaceae bacterium GXIMD 01537]
MRLTLWGVPPSVHEEVGRRLLAECGQAVPCEVCVLDAAPLPDVVPDGLLVLWDEGGPLEEAVARCRRLHARRALARTHLVVLTSRASADTRALAEAGADECLAPPGEHWGARWGALARRQGVEGRAWMTELRAEPQRVRAEAALAELLASTSMELGPDFFRALAFHVARVFRVACAFVGELMPGGDQLRPLALWSRDGFQEPAPVFLRGTPCEDVVLNGRCHCLDGVAERYPRQPSLERAALRGYLGVALRGAGGEVLGVMALLHDWPLPVGPLDCALLEAFAARAGAELERQRAQAELRRASAFLGNVLDALPDPLCVKDRSHRWVAVNDAFCRFMGRGARELLGRSESDFASPEQAQVMRRQAERAFATRQPSESEQTLTDGAGLTRTLFTKAAAFSDASGVPFLVVSIRDITERRRLEGQLRLVDRMASVGTLAAGVAHEINNPLAYVSSSLSFLSEQLGQEQLAPGDMTDMREAVAEALEGTGRVRAIVQDLRTFARPDEELCGPVDVQQVLEGALRLVRQELQHRARLVRELEGVPPVLGSAVRLGQVLVNLLVNAVQSFPEAPGGDNRIRVAMRPCAPGWVEVEVEDNGCGMTPEVQRRIFDPFFTTKPVGVGSGLGLAICHTLIQAMGGTIEVRSAPGQGSTFRLVLPVYQEGAQPV